MANEIDVWKVKQFGTNVYHLAQQKGSRFEQYCRPETINGESKFLDILGPTIAQDRISRNPATPNVAMNHYRRMITMSDKDWGTIIDDMDKLRMIHEPNSQYLMAAVNAFGRKKDDMFINAFTANSIEDKDGGTSTAFPWATRSIAAVNGSAFSGFNVETLILAAEYFNKKDFDPELPRYMAISSKQLTNLLKETEITNSDYANVKALVEGKVDTYMGFKFIRSERLLNAKDSATKSALKFSVATGEYDGSGGTALSTLTTVRECLAWIGNDAMICGKGQDVTTEIGKRADLSFNTQLYIKMSLGFMRMEDDKTLVIFSKEA